MIYNAQNLPVNDNINSYSFCMDVTGEMFIQKGKMIAYYGALKFESLSAGAYDVLIKESFNSPLYMKNFVVVTGRGKLILGDRGNHIASYDLEDGNLTVRSTNVLGFEPTLICQESTVPGYLTLLGSGKFLASSNGAVHFLEPPVRVDEDALLGWADMPSPSYRYDYSYMRGMSGMIRSFVSNRSSGEEKQLDFTGQGTILIQSSETGLVGSTNLETIVSQTSSLQQHELQQLSIHLQGLMRNR
ncbi:MAG: AIM24 family protein [Rubrobacter sp.]|nr:AIM24 family protein [Rubrobacter sp.]